MIRLDDRPRSPPGLARVAKRQVDALRGAMERATPGEVVLAFPPSYGTTATKKALRSWQHGKCAFCESPIAATQHGDVEHYRPKGALLDATTGALRRPGYWWLAYEWSNLFFCCQVCNQSFKRSWFPLVDEAARARTPEDDLGHEAPLLLNPEVDQPSEHLRFEREVAIARSERGELTIRILRLDRDPLEDDRRRRWQLLDALVRVWPLPLDPPDRERVEAVLRAATRKDAPFSAMARGIVPADLHEGG